MRQWWALLRTMGGLEDDSGGAPVSTAPFSELAGEPEAMSWAEMDSTKSLEEEGVNDISVHGESCRKYRQWKMVVGTEGRGF